MSRRLRALLLAASVAGGLPVVAQPASAEFLFGGCAYSAFRDPTDPQGTTWIELTYSAFVGTPDVTSWTITCWLQTCEDMSNGDVDSTEADTLDASSWGNPQPCGEIPNTRHTCSGVVPVGACANPVVFQTHETVYYMCEHDVWTDSGTAIGDPFDIVDHALRDLFSTGGVTTMGGVAQIQATVLLAVTNLVNTLLTPPFSPETHTVWSDNKPLDDPDPDFRKDGLQCYPSDV